MLQSIRTKPSEFTHGSPESLNNIIRECNLPKSDIAVSLSSDPISVRVLKFPFSDPKKIDLVYGFELENISTFDPDEKIHGYHLVKNESGGDALVCVFEKSDMVSTLGFFNSAGIDPKVVTYTPVAFGALDEIIEEARPLMLVDIGEEEMSFSLFDENGLKRVRSSRKPVESFLENLCGYIRVPVDDFRFSKAELAVTGGEHLSSCLAPVLSEVKKTLHFFETELKHSIKTILISGVFSQTPGITDIFRKQFNCDVKKLFIPDLGVDNSALYARSYALALFGSSLRNGYLNYRKEEFKYSGTDRELRRVFITPAILFALLLVLLLYKSVSRYYELKNEVNDLNAQIAHVVKDTFPDVKAIPQPAKFMESEVSKLRQKLNLVQGVQGANTPLEVLREISSSLPPTMKLVVNDIKFESDNKLKIQGVCDSYQEITEIEDALSKSKFIESVTRDQTGNTVDGKTKFELSLVLKSEA
ncbi:MAG: GspL/Epsl periplasmic domain-containing protein [Thermodesulfobacteriota bacterium]